MKTKNLLPFNGSITQSPNAPHVSEKKAAANRQNSQHSTGPQTEAGKQNSSLNGLVHGLYSQTRTYVAMVALGENPLEFERHRARLHASWGFGLDPLFDAEIDELAWLLWRKQRVEGARDSMLVARKEQADNEGRRREREYIRDTVDTEEAFRVGLRRINDSPAAFEQTLTVLEIRPGTSVFQPTVRLTGLAWWCAHSTGYAQTGSG
ncbi:MAG TPA: hypothetical protein VKM93_17940 [Terriglobia bacterium]|nr:hypothetical protein [Terriglobia bacterium]